VSEPSPGGLLAGCTTCDLLARRDRDEAPLWDSILRTPEWDVVHAFGTRVEGWLVVVVRRHVEAMAALTDGEALTLGPLVRDVSRALEAALGCEKTYMAQFAEAKGHHHVHVHVIARAHEWPDDLSGPHVFDGMGLDAQPWVAEERMDEIGAAVRAELERR
jgi:diadenosine tetraphosphate (Ap4A) HIT family hydrolase